VLNFTLLFSQAVSALLKQNCFQMHLKMAQCSTVNNKKVKIIYNQK